MTPDLLGDTTAAELNTPCLSLSYRNQRSSNEKHSSDFDALQYNTGTSKTFATSNNELLTVTIVMV